ncbi:MAG TPA: response regulator [Planctomycetota bacterium]|nr:response regulator [Planctomycetota bacterium]
MTDRTILLVDESTRMRDLLASILRMQGYIVFEYNSGRELLKRLRADRPELLLMEAILPFLSGFEIRAMIRRDPELRDLPVLMMCSMSYRLPAAGSDGQTRSRLDEFIVRPFGLQELLDRIDLMLGASPALKALS